MADFKIGTKQAERPAVDTTTTWREASPLTGDKSTGSASSKDAMMVARALTPYIQKMSPEQQKICLMAIQGREKGGTVATDNGAMHSVYGGLSNILKNAIASNKKSAEKSAVINPFNVPTSGTTFDSDNLFAV